MRPICAVTFALCTALSLSACAAASVVGDVASTAVSAVSTATDVTAGVIKTTANTVTGGGSNSGDTDTKKD